MEKTIRVIVADDHPLLREGVVRSLSETGGFDVVGQGGTADEATVLAQRHRPDIALVDLSMPGNGLTAVQRIRESAPETHVIVLTVSEADDDVIAALRAGAKGYVLKGVGSAALAEILHGVANGESYVSPRLAARLLTEMRIRETRTPAPDDPLSQLSQREEEILRLVATGLSNKEVARRVDLQEKTVKHHMTRILNKLQVRNRTEAAILMREAGPQKR
jgi:DNA-binding NarL/FixJ family response regulator